MATAPPQPDVQVARDAAYVALVQQIRARLEAFVTGAFRSSGSYRDADMARFLKTIVPIVLAGRRQVSSLTDAWLSQRLGTPRLGPIDTDALRGVDAREVYTRPYKTVWTELSNGRPIADAVNAGTQRASSLVLTDLQMAKVQTAQPIMAASDITHYQRTLTGDSSCGLCVVASTQVYSKSDLLPIHPGCDCGVAPIANLHSFNEAGTSRLADAHEAVAERFGQSDASARSVDYRKLLITHEHGEIGPLLAVRGQHFDGPQLITAH